MRFQYISTKVKRICLFPDKHKMIIPTFPYVDPEGEEFFVKLIPKMIPTFAYVDPDKEMLIELLPGSTDVLVVYLLKTDVRFRTAADLILTLLNEGIDGVPMRIGFLHNNQCILLESYNSFSKSYVLFPYTNND